MTGVLRRARPDVPARPDLRQLASRLPPRPLTRFAPSPTGLLHLGHVVNAVYVWGLARALGGRVLLRLEDHDRARCRSSHEAAVLEDLEWLGFHPDLGTPSELRAGASAYRQSDSETAYLDALTRLRQVAPVYACDCSRKEIAEASDHPRGAEPRYPGRCRDRALDERAGRGLRVALEAGLETFDDARLGPQAQDPARQCGDLLLRDRHRYWTYQFAVVVDDWRHGVDLVVRGRDLLDSTGRQVRLGRLLGRTRPPVFLHHELLVKPTGEKLSKASRDDGVRDLRTKGHSPAEVLGAAAHLCGLQDEPHPIEAETVARLFTG